MALSIPYITKAFGGADMQYILNWLISQINTQNVAGTTPTAFPG
jgi:hypothetical protein